MSKITILVMFFFIKNLFCQNCSGINEGIFISSSDYGELIIEKKGNLQLERALSLDAIFLHKIEYINECEYIVKRYKIISLGKISEEDLFEKVKVTVLNVIDKTFNIKSELLGTQFFIESKFKKTSNEISEEFKRLLLNEE